MLKNVKVSSMGKLNKQIHSKKTNFGEIVHMTLVEVSQRKILDNCELKI